MRMRLSEFIMWLETLNDYLDDLTKAMNKR